MLKFSNQDVRGGFVKLSFRRVLHNGSLVVRCSCSSCIYMTTYNRIIIKRFSRGNVCVRVVPTVYSKVLLNRKSKSILIVFNSMTQECILFKTALLL